MKLVGSPSLRLACLISVCGLLSACAAAPPTHRYFQPTADQIGPYPNSYGEAVAPRRGLIAVQGDEMAYGVATGRSRRTINGADRGQGPMTISETLRKVVKGVEVENRGFPGDTVAASAARWANARRADLLILAFGFGDLQAHTPQSTFAEQLTALIRSAQAGGATVFVVIPPHVSKTLTDSDIEAYRGAERGVAISTGAEVFEAQAALTRIKAPPPAGAAQTPQAYQAIAADMVPYIKVVAVPAA